MAIFKDHMLVDSVLQDEIIARIKAGNFGDDPGRAVHSLGMIALPDGQNVKVHLRHAADAILLDNFDHVVLITRTHNPGAGLLAVPGGFLDEVDGIVEDSLTAAIREAVEETGIDKNLLCAAAVKPVGSRRYDRPFDIRRAWNNLPGTNIKKGELFAVSTQGFCFKMTGDLSKISLSAGDDAQAVRVLRISELKPCQFAVPDHLEMIQEVRE